MLLMAIRALVFAAWVFRVRDGYFAALWIIGTFAVEFVLFVYQYELRRRAQLTMSETASAKVKRSA